jgi:preprotein translocase subunit SecG
MHAVILVIHMILAASIIGLVLLQRSEGGGLGIGGGGGGMGGFASPQATANALTRITWNCAAGFFTTSLVLGILAGHATSTKGSIFDQLDQTTAPVTAPAETVPAPAPEPAAPVTE